MMAENQRSMTGEPPLELQKHAARILLQLHSDQYGKVKGLLRKLETGGGLSWGNFDDRILRDRQANESNESFEDFSRNFLGMERNPEVERYPASETTISELRRQLAEAEGTRLLEPKKFNERMYAYAEARERILKSLVDAKLISRKDGLIFIGWLQRRRMRKFINEKE